MVCSYRRDLDKQQQEIEGLKRSYQKPYQGNWNPDLSHVQLKQCGLERAVLSRSPFMFRVSQSDRVVIQSGMEEDTECVLVLNLETLVGIVEERDTGRPASLE